MKKLIFLLILLAFTFSIKAGTYSGGDGLTAGTAFQISTTADLIELSNTSTDWGAFFIQTSDITFDANPQLVDWDGDGILEHPGDDALGFRPIGINGLNYFQGEFNGQGNTISNLFINRQSLTFVGLFGYAKDAILSNINIHSADIHGNSVIGICAGVLENSEISNSTVNGIIRSSSIRTGGFVGFSRNSTFTNCSSDIDIEYQTERVGGFVGESQDGSTYEFCFAKGEVEGRNHIGGFVGQGQGTTSYYLNCYADVIVTGDNSGFNAGGFAGVIMNTEIRNCYSRGDILGLGNSVGGFVGSASASGVLIENCYSTGGVESTNTNVGGFAGSAGDPTDIVDCFWDTETSGKTTSPGGTGETTSEMKDLTTFTDAGWDFQGETANGTEDHWAINSDVNDGYPFLSFSGNPHVGRVGITLIDNIMKNSADVYVQFNTYPGDLSIKERGFVWNKTGSPTKASNLGIFTETGSWTNGNFSSSMTGLDETTLYHVRAYIIETDDNMIYSTEVTFTTIPTLGEWGLMALGSLVALLGGWFVYRKFV